MIAIEAPAKINLTLEVLGERPDGYHELRSVLQALRLHDTMHIAKGDALSFRCDNPSWEADKSLVSRSARMLQEKTGGKGGAQITLEKRIPLSSGLGGDSSDAAAVIKGLNQLWGLEMTSSEMTDFGASFGSDVPFFLDGSTALASGRGEIIAPLPSPTRAWVVLLLPEVRLKESKTGYMYSILKPEHCTSGSVTQALAEHLTMDGNLESDKLYNVFDQVARDVFAGLDTYWQEFQKAACVPVHLAGAGPTLFGVFSDKDWASAVEQTLKSSDLKVILTETLGVP